MSSSLKAINSPLVLEPAPLVARSRKRTVANGDSITLVVRRCFQCSAGKSKKPTRRSQVGGERLHRLAIYGLTFRFEAHSGLLAIRPPLGVHHLVQRAFGAGLQALGQLVEHVGKLVTPAALLASLGPDLTGRGPEPQRTVADRENRCDHSAPLEIAQHRLPALGALTIAVLDREQLLLPGRRSSTHNALSGWARPLRTTSARPCSSRSPRWRST